MRAGNSGPGLTFTPATDGRYYISVVGEANYGGVGSYIVALTDGGSGSGERMTSIGSQGCVPEAPAGLGLSEVTGGSVTLSWTAPAHSAISGYRILRGTDASTLAVIAPDTGSTATSYVDASASPSTTYVYAVVALSAAGEGAPSASASTTTPSPSPEAGAKAGKTGSDPTLAPRNAQLASSTPGATGLTLTPSYDRVTLDWTTPSGDGVSGYRIWRGASAGALTVLVSDTGSTSTSYVDESVEDDTTYHYAVAALNANGAGPQSTSSIATLAAPRILRLRPTEPEEPLIAGQQQAADENQIMSFNDNPIVTFASNLAKPNASPPDEYILTSAEVRLQQSFTTGPDTGYLLHSFGFTAHNANDSPINTVFRITTATEMDAGSLPGWSFGGDIKFGLKGRVVPLRSADDVTPPSGVLVSSLIGNSAQLGGPLLEPAYSHAQRFTTGYHLLGDHIASVSFLARIWALSSADLVVSIHENSGDRPAGAALFTFSGSPVTATSFTERTFIGPPGARLEPDTDYWLVSTSSNGYMDIDDSLNPIIRRNEPGWNIVPGRQFRINLPSSPYLNWAQAGHTELMFTLSGSCPAPTQVECADFPASEATPGRVRLGEYSTGVLDDASDRDWFRIDGLEHYRQYRLEVDFLGANVVGGSFDVFSSTMGRPAVARSDLWDSNYDGHAVLDFWPVAVGTSTMYVQVEADNDMNREDDRNRYTGPYTVTLSELPDVQRMVSNLEQRASDRLTFYNIGHLTEDGLTGHVKEMAIDFTTGSHAAGYTLDKLAAYISMGRRSTTVGTATITGVVGADVAIGPPAHSIVVDDRTLTVVEGDDVSYTVQLSTQPAADVTVITGASDTDLTVSPASLTFTASTWDQAQTVTVSSAEDTDITDDDVTLAHTATGGGYKPYISAVAFVAVRVDDDEDPVVADEPADPGAPALPVVPLAPTNATPQVAIYSNSTNDVPGAELCQIERLTGYETGLVRASGDWPDEMYAGTCAGLALEASTTYWIVFRSLNEHPNSFYRVAESNSNSEDTSGAAGWSIGNQTWSRRYNHSHPNEAWKTVTGSHPLAIGVFASPN